MTERLQAIYGESACAVRASFRDDPAGALAYYSPLLEFVGGIVGSSEAGSVRLLDVGCGSGWSTHAFARAGYQATGIDLNPEAFEPPPHERCRLLKGSATEIPFGPDMFQVVVCYQCLEHVPAPAKALDEMVRVCRPGGIVAIVGPNLVSPLPGLAYMVRPSNWGRIGLWRKPGMPRHPYGNTVGEVLGFAVLRTLQLAGKLVRPSPRFSMREPDLIPPFSADNDACYLCNPVDLIRYFRQRGMAIERRGKPGRWPLAYLLAGGTWVAASKPVA